MTEEQLLKIHHSNIHIYKEAMGHVIVDEQLSTSPKDFTVDFETIQLMKQRVLNREESVMTLLDITLDLLPIRQVVLHPEENEAIRNQRDCYILQEMTLYLPMCLQDFPRLQSKHSEAEPVRRHKPSRHLVFVLILPWIFFSMKSVYGFFLLPKNQYNVLTKK
ncbi:uncharacterized protein [Amphiura filiformis]|uniref:uncharacterized protein n=1 Tax=Amphiura filiformis TaxID=82378 RepID=UPI003B22563C